jgi:uncharacterized protein YajQ (UPF0234 family)
MTTVTPPDPMTSMVRMRSRVQIPVVAPFEMHQTPLASFCYTEYMATFSYDIVSEYDKAEMNNVYSLVQKDIANRYDFKNTPAEIEWMADKAGFKVIGANDWQIESIIDIIRKKLTSRNQSSKSLDLKKDIVTTNLKASKEIPFIAGLTQDKAKQITKVLREEVPKVKALIQGEEVRVTSGSKDDLQSAMRVLESQDFDFPLAFTNFR